ncbi:hypothetical protein [Pseudonocardia sp. ICBG1142]|uniref:hypothetical protein n=1 Tax=Pseudonocardia sp. ICBG1142 TaxID=2846760 RepID=UPI001CF69005|nr:hypothetical protein [Pseudonocardia sp. ICBG1142]
MSAERGTASPGPPPTSAATTSIATPTEPSRAWVRGTASTPTAPSVARQPPAPDAVPSVRTVASTQVPGSSSPGRGPGGPTATCGAEPA